MPIRKILIANRGEIALRIARSAREMGIGAVAICSDAEPNAPHARGADEAVHIGSSYLDIGRIIEAAQKTGADAIHPGYGFLAENADFADACRLAGLIFIGPSPNVIRMMGSKTAARDVAASAGVPIVPAYEHHAPLEFPVIVKASTGGGGRGMRIVRNSGELDEALQSARSEAERAFGDGTLLIEQYVEGARHVEFQIFGDQHGNLIHLFERDCSVQRRHQKIIEGCPSPALDDDLRQRMGQAAIAIGRAMGYTNAGTVEFLLAPSKKFFFIEVNTRIQVEHPVTELVTGLDLVRLQIEVAEGKRLPLHPRMLGHAIEARLYAEDPANGFLPTTGVVRCWRTPENVRVETALEAGLEVGIRYDPLLAKIVSFGNDRETAIRKLVYALRSTRLLGVVTNREYLIQILEAQEFRDGRADTAFLPAASVDTSEEEVHLTAAVLYVELTRKRPLPRVPANYRNNPYRDPLVKLRVHNRDVTVSWKHLGGGEYLVNETRVHAQVGDPGEITLTADGVAKRYAVHVTASEIFVQSPSHSTTITRLDRYPRPAGAQRETANSPMPGQVLRILVEEGQQVKTGDSLVVLEAMKMEQTIRTTINGVVQSVLVKTGQVVAPGQMLVQISAEENPT